MFKNYTNRVKNFIIDMNNPETQITLNNDKNSKDESYKKRFYSKKTFLHKKPFIFKGYENETERIKEHIKNNQYLNGIYDSNGNIVNNNKKENMKLIKNKRKTISSSNMDINNKSINLSQNKKNISLILRKIFSKKNFDLNRLYESLDKNYKSKNKIMNIKSFSNIKNRNNFSDIINRKEMIKDFGTSLILNNKSQNVVNNLLKKVIKQNINQRKINKSFKGQNSDNDESIKSYHNKLYFKAAEEIAENELDKRNKYKLLPKLFKKKLIKDKNDSNSNINEECEENEDELYDSFYYKNPFKNIKKREIYNPKLMEKLSKIAFKKNTNLFNEFNFSNISNIKKEANVNQTYDKNLIKPKKIKDENEIEIDGEIFQKTSQFNLITKKILKKCNVYVNKSIKNKNRLKAGDGKNMMTKGLSINNFLKKYKFK